MLVITLAAWLKHCNFSLRIWNRATWSWLHRLRPDKATQSLLHRLRPNKATWSLLHRLRPNLAHNLPFELDPFRREAMLHLEQGHSVFVAQVETKQSHSVFVALVKTNKGHSVFVA